MIVPLRATLRGRVRWQALDERGVPEIPRTPSGVAVATADGVEQPNLITNLGLDGLGTIDFRLGVTSATWRKYLAVGTGSTAPAVTDTTLDAEVQRAASAGAFTDISNAYSLDDDLDVWLCESVVNRVVTMTADRNLTEFALSPSVSADVQIRELLRDELGDPVTISLLNGKTLRVEHTLRIELPAPETGIVATVDLEQYDAGNNLTGTTEYDIVHGGRVTTANNEYVEDLFGVWTPGNTQVNGLTFLSAAGTYGRVQSASLGTDRVNATPEGYTPGTYQRVKSGILTAGQANTTWHGFTCKGGSSTQTQTGWMFYFTDPLTYVKPSTDEVALGILSSWARA